MGNNSDRVSDFIAWHMSFTSSSSDLYTELLRIKMARDQLEPVNFHYFK